MLRMNTGDLPSGSPFASGVRWSGTAVLVETLITGGMAGVAAGSAAVRGFSEMAEQPAAAATISAMAAVGIARKSMSSEVTGK
jgi:hypothetical protein